MFWPEIQEGDVQRTHSLRENTFLPLRQGFGFNPIHYPQLQLGHMPAERDRLTVRVSPGTHTYSTTYKDTMKGGP